MKIALTGGHLTPALAVIDELKKKPDNEIIFIGRAYSMEGDKSPSAESVVIPNLGIKFYSIQAGRLQRKFTRHTILALAKVPLGSLQALAILSKEKPDVVMSFGSYVAFPSIFAAWVLGIPTITHEQTLKGGLSTRLISRFVKKIAVSWKDSKEFFAKEKVVLTGNPIRKEILNLERKRSARPVVYITGGNQGSHVINEIVEEILPNLLENYEVIHQTGSSEAYKDFENAQKKVQELPKRLKNRYLAAKWFNSDEVADIFSRSSLIVSRAGANTVFEVAALCLPAIFIPIPWSSGDEQTKNASVLSDLKAALILPQDRLTPRRLLSSIKYVFDNYGQFKKAAKAASKFVAHDAARLLVEEAEKLVKENETNQILPEKKTSV
ncbi:MAG: UDP-N-acetylglucosamine--N-acetylmuramyl-(pentapeptide) pyrophosphoryl-undecaprenol N-acetylglucosamine transferase [bacterium]|nr:UDP-N-acetylglucosamine--N-acetylmuramyl-(pentapeptide) pyrophosphoryl-undecaprenol N-acetylglucosamine transferase [bacterium]